MHLARGFTGLDSGTGRGNYGLDGDFNKGAFGLVPCKQPHSIENPQFVLVLGLGDFEDEDDDENEEEARSGVSHKPVFSVAFWRDKFKNSSPP
jgi:hypothetical protein